MDKKELPKRKATRLKDFDYNTNGAYFLTICTLNRREILSAVGVDVLGDPQNIRMLPYGEIAEKYIKQLNEFYDHITVEQYVIMPNHIHLLLFVSGSPGMSTPTKQASKVSNFVSTFKRFCNKECGGNIWQRGFYDHVVRGHEDYAEIKKYIEENPASWYYDELYTKKSP